MLLLSNWILSAFCLYVLSYFFKGIYFSNFTVALVAAIVFGFINSFIKPILQFFSIPITLMTLGLFSFVINAFMLILTSNLVDGFYINNFGTAFLASIVLAFLNSVFIKK